MSEPKFTGVWIPAGVFQHKTLSTSAKVVYGVVDALDNDDGCFASNAYLSKHLGLSVRQLQAILFELQDATLIRRMDIEGRRVIRTVEKVALQNALANAQVTRSEEGCGKPHGGVKKTAGGGCGKPHTYSKDDNKEDIDTKKNAPWTVELPFNSEAFSKAWQSWIDYRKQIKKPIMEATMNAQWKEFAKWGESKSIISIEMSIKNGWQGLFEPARSQGGDTKTLTSKDHSDF